MLRSDRGGGFLAGIFQGVCDEAGFRRQMTAPYTPQQNGVVERKNKIVMEMTRAVLKSMRVPSRFWAEAVRHSVYLLNRLPTKAMGYRTPYEAWNGRRPHLGHLKIFGCKGHVRSTVPHLKKLDDRSVPMVYFGIEEGSKAHRMFNPQTNRIVDMISPHENAQGSYQEHNEMNVDENVDSGDELHYYRSLSEVYQNVPEVRRRI